MEQLGVITNVGYGMYDRNEPCLWFDVYIEEGRGSLQILNVGAATDLIKDARLYDVHRLEGMPCWVEVDGGEMRFLRIAKIGKRFKGG